MLEYGSSSIKDIIDNSTKLLTSNLEWTVGTGGGASSKTCKLLSMKPISI
ncbi:receptor binding protein 3 [Campylobacter phage vB_Cj_QDYZ]|uniref:Receptor binding protein 3 n=1 Tax=Campylobacter phage vB_Cj_QDYZ TaxID=3032374 RepID=A0AAF0GCG3_9CAUD|nr:receptor binding protein 3 [Campylobacter phage vB_Cj_QDYZ]